jgi:nicotinamidase/pyrazinamidase
MKTHPQIFVDVDTQNDFLDPNGALFIRSGLEILDNLGRLTAYARRRRVPVLSSACAHGEDDAEFSQFPRHCVTDTWGQLKLACTLLPRRVRVSAHLPVAHPAELLDRWQQVILEKTEFDVFSNPNADEMVNDLTAERFVVYGVATDYCVKAWVEGLLKRGKKVVLLSDTIRAVDPWKGEEIVRGLCKNGATLMKAADVMTG